jgi:PAS domain S-box-containing protein
MVAQPARPSTIATQAGRHLVHFYDREDQLADVVTRYLADGLSVGEPAVVIATPAHRELFLQRLRALDVDVETARAAGELTILDAAGTLARFMVDGAPDRESFHRVVGSVIQGSCARGTQSMKIRAYGEMVDLLWQAGTRTAALALEELWNELAGAYPFDLLCAYSMAGFPDVHAGGRLSAVCHTHTEASAASVPAHAGPDFAARTRLLAAENAHRRQVEKMLRGTLGRLREAAAGERDRAEHAARIVDELRETVRVNELFVGVLAHDLRAPLAAIMTAAQLMKVREANGDPRTTKALDRVLNSSERMSRMIEQLLDFTRLRVGGGVAVEPRRADMAALARQAVDELQDSYPGCGAKVTHEGDTCGAWDADRLSQVLSNLVANALQHGDPNAGVRVFIDGRAANAVLVQVHNMGAIPAGQLPQIFDPLTGGGQRRHDRSRGLGLGLFISKQIATAHGGDVQVTSSEGEGTLFTLSLPRFAHNATDAQLAMPVAADAGPAERRAPPDFAGLAHERLHESETRFRLLVEAVKDYAIFMLDPNGRVITWNAGAERIKGYEAREIIGRHFSEFYEEQDVRSGKCERGLEVAARDGRFEDEGWRVRKDRTRFWANVVLTALRAPNGELVGFAKVTRDLTERRRLEQEQLRLGKAEEAIRLRDEFLSLAAHELKTPLTVLQLQLDTLGGRSDPGGQRAATKLQRAARSSERLASLVESLLDVSRIATGRFALKRERIQLADCVSRVVDALGPSANQARCELIVDTRGPIVGLWDPLRIEQALTNLLVNALKYGAGRPIRISARERAGEALLEVRDHGPGIPESDLGRLFQRFERAASMRNYGGLGLGLYLIQGIVEAHGGTVTAANAPDGGACFRITLPLRPAAAPIDALGDVNATDVN